MVYKTLRDLHSQITEVVNVLFHSVEKDISVLLETMLGSLLRPWSSYIVCTE